MGSPCGFPSTLTSAHCPEPPHRAGAQIQEAGRRNTHGCFGGPLGEERHRQPNCCLTWGRATPQLQTR